MNSARFGRFAEELRVHAHAGYHKSLGGVSPEIARAWFAEHAIAPHESYLEFLERFGPGRYFAGAFEIFSLDDTPLGVSGNLETLEPKAAAKWFVCGYGGVSSESFALRRNGADATVNLVVDGGLGRKLHSDFATWIDQQPRRLFKKDTYKCYGPVKAPDEIARVVRERAEFRVRCVEFDTQLLKSPANPEHDSPRFHRVRIGVTKLRDVSLATLTVRVWRTGTEHGAKNIWYESLPVADSPIGTEVIHEIYSFDAYGRGAESIEVLHEPEIDLSNNQRGNFEEIRDYL